jgi:hypothetical protein
VAGFASGWLVRSSVDSSRGAIVSVLSAFHGARERARRVVAMEREHWADLMAEARARYEVARSRRSSRRQRADEPANVGLDGERAA